MKNAALLVLILLLGCTAANGGDVVFSTIAHGDNAPGITGRLDEVITDPVSYEDFWKHIYRGADPVPDIPKVDFAKDMVIVVSTGRMLAGGYNVEIVKIEDEKTKLDVTILVSRPSGDDAQALTQPYHIIKLEKRNVPIVYKWVER